MLTSREVAVSVWAGVLLVWACSHGSVRDSLLRVIGTALNWKILIPILGLCLWGIASCFLLWWLGLWSVADVKESGLWLVFCGFPLLFSAFDAMKRDSFWRHILSGQLRVAVILEVIVSQYTLSLPAELVLVPFVVAIGLIQGVADGQSEFLVVNRLLTAVLLLLGLSLVGFAIVQLILHFSATTSESVVKGVLLPPMLSFLVLPYAYLIALWVSFDSLYRRIGWKRDNTRLFNAKSAMRVLAATGFRPRRVDQVFRKCGWELAVASKNDLQRLLDGVSASSSTGAH